MSKLKSILSDVTEALVHQTIKKYDTKNKGKVFSTKIDKLEKGKRKRWLEGNDKDDMIYRVDFPDLNLYYRVFVASGDMSTKTASVQLFTGTKEKPKVWRKVNYNGTINDLKSAVDTIVDPTITKASKDLELKTARTETLNSVQVSVGDIFAVTWGYNQNQLTAYQVVKMIGKKSVSVREIETEYSNFDMDQSKPVKDQFSSGDTMTKKLLPSYSVDGGPEIKMDSLGYRMKLWDGVRSYSVTGPYGGH